MQKSQRAWHGTAFILISALMLLTACSGGSDGSAVPVTPPTNGADMPEINADTPKISREIIISGFAQKGPLQKGSTIKLYELDTAFKQTGVAYQTDILNDTGEYQLPVNLGSQYVEIYAKGFFFDEMSGKRSDSWLTLDAYADTQNSASININLLTSLAKSRTITLIHQGQSFDAANAQSQREVLRAFKMDDDTQTLFKGMNIFETGDKGIRLMAVSAIVMCMAHMNDSGMASATLTELIDRISSDLQDNGRIDDEALNGVIADGILKVRPIKIKRNLETRFPDMTAPNIMQLFDRIISGPLYQNRRKYRVTTQCESDCTNKGSPLFLGLSGGSEFIMIVDDQGHITGAYGDFEGYIKGSVVPDGTFEVDFGPKDIPDTILAHMSGTISSSGEVAGSFYTLLPLYRRSEGNVVGNQIKQ